MKIYIITTTLLVFVLHFIHSIVFYYIKYYTKSFVYPFLIHFFHNVILYLKTGKMPNY